MLEKGRVASASVLPLPLWERTGMRGECRVAHEYLASDRAADGLGVETLLADHDKATASLLPGLHGRSN